MKFVLLEFPAEDGALAIAESSIICDLDEINCTNDMYDWEANEVEVNWVSQASGKGKKKKTEVVSARVIRFSGKLML
jgi:hypothetical protein